jgi:autotransporter-associated beta strand protein
MSLLSRNMKKRADFRFRNSVVVCASALAVSQMLLCIGASSAQATTFIVSDNSDVPTDSASLPYAIAHAQNGDTINMNAGLGNITLTSALPVISTGITINGNGDTVSGNNLLRVFFVDASGQNVTFNNVNIANGNAHGGNGGAGSGGGGLGAGGGLFVSQGNVTISGVSFTNNSAVGGQGGAPVSLPAFSTPVAQAGGGGGGLGGNGGATFAGQFGIYAGGGGGGYAGNGGAGNTFASTSTSAGGGGGGGITGSGGDGSTTPAGGGGGGVGNGASAGSVAGTGGTAGGGNGSALGGGGGGGSANSPGATVTDINGGNGGRYGGGGGGGRGSLGINGNAGNGGDFGGGGGSAGFGGNGGFGGGGGAGLYASGNGGFGGGGAGTYASNGAGAGGAFAGNGGLVASTIAGGGGGGAALGGAVFVAGGIGSGASLTVINSSADQGSLTAGQGGTGGAQGQAGQTAGSALFLNGPTTFQVDSNQTQTIAGSIADAGPFVGSSAPGFVAASLTKTGAGTLVLNGNNSYTGGTTINGGTLAISNDAGLGALPNNGATAPNVTLNGGALGILDSLTTNSQRIIELGTQGGTLNAPVGTTWNCQSQITGTGALTETGGGALVLSEVNAYTGNTDVNAGTMQLLGGTVGSPQINIASGATLEYDTSGTTYQPATTYQGAGTLRVMGTGNLTFGGLGTVNVDFSPGALIDVEGSTLTGTYGYQGNWTANQASLNIGSGATFNAVEGGNTESMQFDALSGAGTFLGGYAGSFNGGETTVTLGVAGGSGTFGGSIGENPNATLNIVKSGAGTQTFSGSNTYTGSTSVNGGTLRLVNDTLNSFEANIVYGAVLEYNDSTNIVQGAGTDFMGVGTLRKSGSGNLILGAAVVDFSTGGLIDVEGGTLTASAGYGGGWMDNQGSLNIAAGATFDAGDGGFGGIMQIDALTGAGTLVGGNSANSNGGLTTLILGSGRTSGTFSGSIQNNAGARLGIDWMGFSGTETFTGVNTYTGGTTVEDGTILIGANGALPVNGSVSITYGTLQLGRSTGLAQISSLSITGGGNFDVNNNRLIINYGSGTDPISSIVALLKTGYAGAEWNGAGGIVSTAAAAGTRYGVAIADGKDGVVAGLTSGEIEVAYALYGDINQDGVVNGSDFAILASHFGQSVTGGWEDGDFNYDGTVNGSDFAKLAGNFGDSASGAAVTLPASQWAALDSFAASYGLLADVPEPSTLAGTIIAGALIFRRRRHRSR